MTDHRARPIDLLHDELMARARAEHEARTAADRAATSKTRAEALLEAADRYERILASAAAEHSSDPRYYTGVRDVILGLRRLAGEAQQDPTQPRRGDQFEQWLKTQRDEWAPADSAGWRILDQALQAYRLHADTRTPLAEHVCEGRAVGDCECLERSAAVARSGQPETEA